MLWGEWMNNEVYKEIKKAKDKRIEEQFELEEKMDRIAHPLKHKIIDAKDNFAIWLLRL